VVESKWNRVQHNDRDMGCQQQTTQKLQVRNPSPFSQVEKPNLKHFLLSDGGDHSWVVEIAQ